MSARLDIAVLGARGYPSTYGGFETFVRRLAPWLSDRGHKVTVYGRGRAHRSVADLHGVTTIDTRGVDSKSLSTVTHGLSAALDCRARRPDVALVLNIANGPSLPLLRARGIPTVVNVDGIEWERDKWGSLSKAAFRLGARMTARFADQIVADSEEIGRIWRETFGVQATFIPYGADPEPKRSFSRVEDIGVEPGSYVLVVARIVPENNIALFLDAMAQLRWRWPVVVVGSANYRSPLESRLEALAEAGSLRWLGHVQDQELLAELWSHCGVYFHGHSVGGTNPALLQALGFGAPVVAVDTPYNREVLGHVDWLSKPDAGLVASAVDELMTSESLRDAAKAIGLATVRERYAWPTVLQSYEAALLEAAASKRARR